MCVCTGKTNGPHRQNGWTWKGHMADVKHKTKPAFSQIHIQPMSKGPRPTTHKGNMQHAQTKPLRNKNTCSWFHERMNDCDLTSAHWNDVYLADIVCHEPLVVYAKRWLTVHEWQINGVLIVSGWCQHLSCLLIGMTCGFWIFLVLTWSVLSHAVNIPCLSRTAGCLCLVSHSSQWQINRFITAEPGLQEVTQGKNAQVHRTGIGNDVEYACS